MQTSDPHHSHAPEPEPEPTLYAVVAEFYSGDALVQGARKLREEGYTRWDAYSPYPVHGIDPALGIRPTVLPWIVLGAGLSGTTAAILLQWYTNAFDYPFKLSGKPIFSLTANIPVAFELTILFAALAAFFGMLVLNRLAEFYHPLFGSKLFSRVTTDRFVIAIEASDPKFDLATVRRRCEEAGAIAIEDCYEGIDTPAVADGDDSTSGLNLALGSMGVTPGAERPKRRLTSDKIPTPIGWAVAIATLIMLIPPGLVAKARLSKSAEPPFRWDAGMAFQPKLKPQTPSHFFPDGREQRLPVPGTVARGDRQINDALYRGKLDDGTYIKGFPMTVTPQMVRRGQERFNIYCSVCHGLTGAGDGLVAKRAEVLQEPMWVPPISLYAEHVQTQPEGQIFETITNGIRTMPPYGTRIEPEDRWAIILYVRSLQRSQAASLNDVPADMRATLK
jgi:mono/diheme cytochrome c family protein